MAMTRAFYIVQGKLQVREPGRANSSEPQSFADSDEGLRKFDQYLAINAELPSLVLVDVIEEVFSTDAIPKLGGRDRKVLLQRRVQRKFARTPYRLPIYCSRKSPATTDVCAVYSAVSNHELLDPWISIILRHRTPLTGIHSVPLMAPEIMARLFKVSGPTLLVTQHQGDKLRQAFVQDKLVKSARLSQSPSTTSDEYPQFIITEIQRSRRYLERARLLSSMEQLDVCMIVDPDIAEQIIRCGESNSPIRMHFLKPDVAAKRLHVKPAASDRLEALYVQSALRNRPRYSYAVSGENRYWRMSQIRRAIMVGALSTAAACSVFAGIYLGEAWRLYRESKNIDAQVTQLSRAYRRENETLAPIKAGTYEMKLAVDTGDYILQQRVPVPWVMQQLGTVLGDYRNIRVVSVSWEAQTEAVVDAAPRRRGEPAAPVTIPAIAAVHVDLTANIEPFNGNMRDAFEQIDRLIDDISSRTAFSDAWASEYPVDASTRASISGEVGRDDDERQAKFRLRLSYPVTVDQGTTGRIDDPV